MGRFHNKSVSQFRGDMATRYIAAGLLAFLSLADIVVTRTILNEYGGYELNPLLAPYVDTYGLFLVKTLGVAIVAFLAAHYLKTKWIINVLYAAVGFYVLVVAWNVTQIVIVEVM